ncbi:MAG TPA: response regulator [Candidatus Saccharimonadales bacterium]|nr:response regulator [Candidatus Saccharimonadales bacterium]
MSQSKGRILCVDDDHESCAVVTIMLNAEGYEVHSAETISQALSLIKSEGFILYIIDEKLPDGFGNDLCRKIRERDLQTPIIIHSAAARESDIEAAMEAGANGYLIKPHGWASLQDTVKKLLPQNRSDN